MNKMAVFTLGALTTFIPLGLILILLSDMLYFRTGVSNLWVMIVLRTITALIILLAVGLIYHLNIKLFKMLNKQQIESNRIITQKDLEKRLAELNHEFQLENLSIDIRRREIELEMEKLKM